MSPGRWPVKYASARLLAALTRALLVAGAALAAAAPGLAEARAAEARAPLELPDGYLVVPFENASTVKALDWMSTALAMTAAEKLEAITALRPAYGAQVLDGLHRGAAAEKVARRAREVGARWVLAGSFARPNWKSELRLRLFVVVDPTDTVATASLRLVAEAGSVGERERLVDQLDAALVELLQKAKLPADSDEVTQLKRRPTKDLYALTLYGRALNAFFALGEPRDLGKAEKLLKKASLIDPKFAEAHRVLGLVHLEAGDRGRAAAQYAYALDLKPGYYAAESGLLRLFRAEGNRARAQELCERMLEARPYDVETRELLGELLYEAGLLDEAQAQLERVTQAAPRHLQARRTLALIYAAKGQVGDLAAELERVQELAPEDVDVKMDLGAAYQRIGQNDRAIAVYEEVLRRQPRNVQALKLAGDCYRRDKDPEKAVTAYLRVRKLQPEDPRAYFLLGAAYQEVGDDAKAEAIFQDAQQFKRYLGEAWTNLGAIAFRRGDLSKANWYLSRAVTRSPTRPKAHYNYALVLSAKKERDRALDELRLAGDLDPQDAEIRYLAGVILLRLGRLDEAKAQFQEALKRRPEHADAKHNLALLEDLDRRYGGERSGVGAR